MLLLGLNLLGLRTTFLGFPVVTVSLIVEVMVKAAMVDALLTLAAVRGELRVLACDTYCVITD